MQPLQQVHAVTLTESFMQSGGIRIAKNYKLDAGVGDSVDLTTTGPTAQSAMPKSGTWEDIDKQTVQELYALVGISHTLKGENMAGLTVEGCCPPMLCKESLCIGELPVCMLMVMIIIVSGWQASNEGTSGKTEGLHGTCSGWKMKVVPSPVDCQPTVPFISKECHMVRQENERREM